jgi:RND family efflux transporter MFP subunit
MGQTASGFYKEHRFLALVLFGLFVFAVAVSLMERNAVNGAAAGPETFALERRDMETSIVAQGIFKSSDTRMVNSSSMSPIKEIYVEVGDVVTSGQRLARLDSDQIELSIATAERSIADAQAASEPLSAAAAKALAAASTAYAAEKAKQDEKVVKAEASLVKAVESAQTKSSAYADSHSLIEKTKLDNAKLAYKISATAANLAAMNEAQAAFDKKWQEEYQDALADRYKTTTEQNAYTKAIDARDAALAPLTAVVSEAQARVDLAGDTSAVQQLKGQLAIYRSQLNEANVTSPIDGTITGINVIPGMPASANAFVVEDLTTLQVVAAVADYKITSIKLGMVVSVESDAVEGKQWAGTINKIDPVADAATGNFNVTIGITGELGELKGGMKAKVSIATERREAVFAVPSGALTKDTGGKDIIYYLEDALAETGDIITRPVQVEVGLRTDYYVEISAPALQVGMKVVSDPTKLVQK